MNLSKLQNFLKLNLLTHRCFLFHQQSGRCSSGESCFSYTFVEAIGWKKLLELSETKLFTFYCKT